MTSTVLHESAALVATEGDLVDGRYRLLGRIGAGASAQVWTAEDVRLERIVALKLFGPNVVDRHRERVELELMVRLSHPGLVSVFDAGSYTDRAGGRRTFLALEFVAGGTLRDRLATGALPAGRAAALGADLAATLGYVHGRGVIHRDVKPANVLLLHGEDTGPTDLPLAKLGDFGVARLVDGAHLTEPGTAVGTANYISPEQLRGRPATPASDVYALGLVLLEALTGTKAFPGAGALGLANLDRTPVVPARLGALWCALLCAMTAPDPDTRPATAEVASALLALR